MARIKAGTQAEPFVGVVRAYERVSTDEQADEGYSLPVQRDKLEKYADVQWGSGVEVVHYVDDGASAKNLNRDALRRLRQEAQPGDVVLVYKLDRLTRSVRDLYELLHEWDEKGVLFRSATEAFDTSTSEGKFMIGLLGLLAEWERLRIGERVREVMNGIMSSGAPRPLSKPPYGYRMVNGRWEIHPGEAEVVRAIFDEYIRGKGTRAIAVWLNQHYPKRDALWSDYSVSYILSNPAYIGKLTWNRIVEKGKRVNPGGRGNRGHEYTLVDGEHEPIITPEVWEAAQAVKGRRNGMAPRQATSKHVLTGLAFCGKCGGPISGVTQNRYKDGVRLPDRSISYYRCSRRDHYQTCDLPYFHTSEIEERVIQQIAHLADPAVLERMANTLLKQADLETHRRRIAELEARLRKLDKKRSFYDEEVTEGSITRSEWRERTAEIRQEQAQLREELEHLRRNVPVPVDVGQLAEQLGKIAEVWEELVPEERKTVLQALIERIDVYPDGSVVVKPRVCEEGLIAVVSN